MQPINFYGGLFYWIQRGFFYTAMIYGKPLDRGMS